MNRFTTDTIKLRAEIKKKLSDFTLERHEQIVVSYEVFSAFFINPFRVIIIEEANGNFQTALRLFNSSVYFPQCSHNIYNLDRLPIFTNSYTLSHTQQQKVICQLNSLSQQVLPQKMNDGSMIVIDGVDYVLKIGFAEIKVNYEWKWPLKDVYELFSELINNIEELHADFLKQDI